MFRTSAIVIRDIKCRLHDLWSLSRQTGRVQAVAVDKIDEAAAEEARQRTSARLREKISSEEVASVNATLARSGAILGWTRLSRSIRIRFAPFDYMKSGDDVTARVDDNT